MKRLIALLLAFCLIACPVFADADEGPCEHFRVWADWNEILSTEALDGEQHRITALCPDCGETVCQDQDHTFFLSAAEFWDGQQHRRMKSCSDCEVGFYVYADHIWQYGEWQADSEELYYRTAVCTDCGVENPVPEFYEVRQSEETQGFDENQSEVTPSLDGPVPPSLVTADAGSGRYPVAVISVTVPDNLPLTATGDGYVYAIDNLSIVNHSDGAVKVTGITIDAAEGWSLMPFVGSKAAGNAEVKSIGFSVNGAFTAGWGQSESLCLPGNWTIAKGASLPLDYTATVSFADIPREGEQVLSLTFILEWA